MSLFFRNLRRRLLAQKKFGRYLLYAVGEILILMIGILMALNVNNWNIEQQNKNSEIEILKAIKAELEFNSLGLAGGIEIHGNQIKSSEIIINQLENNRPYHDSLSKHFLEACNFTINALNKGAYETLKSVGVGTISNPELRSQIISLYDLHYVFLDEFAKGLQNNFLHGEKYIFNTRFEEANNYWWELGENLEIMDTDGGMTPLNFEALKNDHEYKYYLKSTKNSHKLYLNTLMDTIKNISKTVESIDEELKELEN